MIASAQRVPTFIQEPPAHVIFSNDTGTHLSCSAQGNPTPSVSWILKDGSIVTPVPGLRYVWIRMFNFFFIFMVYGDR